MATPPVLSSSGPTPLPDQLKGSFDPALYNFLFKLHPSLMGKKIDVQSGTNIIYGQYGGSMLVKQEPDDDQLWKLLVTLLSELKGDPFFQPDSRSDLIPMQKAVDTDALTATGYIWYDSGDSAMAQKRVYIHANGCEGAVAVMNCLAGEIDGDFRGAKLWGPYWWNKKVDTVVAYCTSEAGQNKVLRAVKPLKPAAFLPGLPAFVKMISPGVGIADNPPQVKVFEDDEPVQSFGKFMSKLICLAYLSSEGRGVRDFLRQVLVAFRVAGIDPLKPHEHSRCAEVERMKPNLAQMLATELKK
jgi:hypothetical protein